MCTFVHWCRDSYELPLVHVCPLMPKCVLINTFFACFWPCTHPRPHTRTRAPCNPMRTHVCNARSNVVKNEEKKCVEPDRIPPHVRADWVVSIAYDDLSQHTVDTFLTFDVGYPNMLIWRQIPYEIYEKKMENTWKITCSCLPNFGNHAAVLTVGDPILVQLARFFIPITIPTGPNMYWMCKPPLTFERRGTSNAQIRVNYAVNYNHVFRRARLCTHTHTTQKCRNDN